MNETTTITKTTSYHLEATAFEEEIDLSNAAPTLREIEALVNIALSGCVKDGKTPLGVSLCQPGEYLRLVVHGVDADAPLGIKEVLLERLARSNEIKQEA